MDGSVKELEAELARALTRHNKESSELHCQIAELLRQLELGQAEKQELEASLVNCRKLKKQAEVEHDREKQEMRRLWRSEVAMATKQCQEWEKTLDAVQETRAKEREDYQQTLSYRERKLTWLYYILDQKREEAQQLQAQLLHHHDTAKEMAQAVSDRELALRRMEEAMEEKEEKVAALEAAGRETQSDVRRKLKAQEELMMKEKMIHRQLQLEHDFKIQQLKELQLELASESKSHRHTGEELDKLLMESTSSLEAKDREIESLKRQLKSLDNKNIKLESLCQDKQIAMVESSQRTSTLQDEIGRLQQELDEIQGSLGKMESEYEKTFQDSILMLHQFQSRLKENKEEINGNSTTGEGSAKVFLEKLQQYMVSFLKQHSSIEEAGQTSLSQLVAAKQEIAGLLSECDHYKKRYRSTNKALKKTTKRLQASLEELHFYRKHISRLQDKLGTLEEGLGLQSELVASQQTKIAQLKRKLAATRESHLKVLHCLEDELNCVDASKSNHREDCDGKMLVGVVKHRVKYTVKELEDCRVELKAAGNTIDRQRTALEVVGKLHEDAAAKLGKLCTEKTTESRRHQEENFKMKYDKLLTEQEKLLGLLQNEAKSCTEKVETLQLANKELETSKKKLEDQLELLRNSNTDYREDRACLLSCVCLLLGSVFPIHDQVQQLRFQKHYLTYCLSKIGPSSSSSGSGPEERLVVHQSHLKVVGLAIVAIHRLKRQARNSSRLFKHHDRLTTNNLPERDDFPIFLGMWQHECFSHGQGLAHWLRSESVVSEARTCMSDAQIMLDQLAGGTSATPIRQFKEVVRIAYHFFVQRTRAYFKDQFLYV